MDAATAIQNFSLTMKRNFKVDKKTVYEAWTSKQALIDWFAPTKEMTTVVHEMELKIGGVYQIEMIEPNGTSHKVHGEYVALNPFNQIVFTWRWESDEQKVNSLVTIDFSENEGSTDMVLIHEKLASQESVDLHSEGWMGCLAQLGNFIN